MKNTVAILLLFCVVIAFGIFTKIIGFHYPHVIENQPLRNPIAIEAVNGSTITLADGRILELDPLECNGREAGLLSAGSMIEIEERSPDEVIIWGNKRGWVCGTPWAQPIRIPLIADDVYRNRREILGFATFKASKIKDTEQDAASEGDKPQ